MRGIRVSAERLERLLLSRLSPLDERQGEHRIFDAIVRVTITPDRLSVTLDASLWIAEGRPVLALLELAKMHVDPHAVIEGSHLRSAIDAKALRRGRTIRPRGELLESTEQRFAMADLVRVSHRVLTKYNASPLEPGHHGGMSAPTGEWERSRIMAGLLAPDIQKALLLGTAPKDLDPSLLLSVDIPLGWDEQRRMFRMSQ